MHCQRSEYGVITSYFFVLVNLEAALSANRNELHDVFTLVIVQTLPCFLLNEFGSSCGDGAPTDKPRETLNFSG